MVTDTRDRIVGYLNRKDGVRPHDLARGLGIGRAALHRQLRRLESEGKIIKEGKAPKVMYRAYVPKEEAKRIADMIRPVLKRYKVAKAELFGSAAYGGMTSDSDVDVLVELPRGGSLLDLAHLKQEIENQVGRTVDVVTYRSVHPYIKDYVFEKTYGVI